MVLFGLHNIPGTKFDRFEAKKNYKMAGKLS